MAYLYGLRLASMHGHAHSEPLEHQPANGHEGGRVRLLCICLCEQLCWPGQQQQPVLHIQGPSYCINWVMEGHCKGITLCQDLHTRTHQRSADRMGPVLRAQGTACSNWMCMAMMSHHHRHHHRHHHHHHHYMQMQQLRCA